MITSFLSCVKMALNFHAKITHLAQIPKLR